MKFIKFCFEFHQTPSLKSYIMFLLRRPEKPGWWLAELQGRTGIKMFWLTSEPVSQLHGDQSCCCIAATNLPQIVGKLIIRQRAEIFLGFSAFLLSLLNSQIGSTRRKVAFYHISTLMNVRKYFIFNKPWELDSYQRFNKIQPRDILFSPPKLRCDIWRKV